MQSISMSAPTLNLHSTISWSITITSGKGSGSSSLNILL